MEGYEDYVPPAPEQKEREGRIKRCKFSEEADYINRLPDSLIIDEILSRLRMKDAVKTGVLSTRWKNLWTYNPNLSSNDYISRLPDSIIHDIISRLQKKEAAKTGVLSTRWKHLWTSNPNLTFGTFFDIRDDQQYASFVNKTLARYNSYNNKVRKFFLSCYLDIFDGEWLRFAIRHGVENLNLFLLDRNSPSNKICNLGLIDRTICFPYDEEYIRYQIPQDLYALSSLTHLGTTLCDHAPKAGVSWTSLKELYIGRAALTEDVIQRIFAGAPLLERLELYRCWGLNSIQVSSMSALKELVIRKWLDPHWRPRDILNLNTLIISIPNVKSLKLGGDCWQTKCMLLDASSLVEADLEFSLVAEDSLAISLVVKERDIQEYAAMVKKMLLRITSVCKLRVGPMFLRALSCSKEALPPPGWSLQHCKSLTLSMESFKRNLPAISIFLNSASTNLEELSIYIGHYEDWYGFDKGNLEDYWSTLEHLQFMKLKVIWIGPFHRFTDYYDDCCDSLLRFAQFMLKRATVLEKMIIISPCTYDRFDLDPKFRLYDEMARQLLTVPKCSPKAEIIRQGEPSLPRF